MPIELESTHIPVRVEVKPTDGTFNAILAIAIAGVTLAITPGALLHYDITPKLAILLVSLGAVLGFLKRTRSVEAIHSLLSEPEGKRFALAVAALWCSVLISTIDSPNMLLSIGGTGWRRFGIISVTALLAWTVVIAAQRSVDPGVYRTVMRTLAISGSAASIYAAAQFLGFDPWQSGVLSRGRPAASFGHPNYLGAFLVFSGLAGVGLMQEEHRPWRYFGVFTSTISTWSLLLTGTRGAVLGLLAAAVVCALMLRGQVRWSRAAAWLTVFCLSFGTFAFSPLAGAFRGRLSEWVADPLGGTRLLLWRDVARMAADRPLVGHGPEVFVSSFPKYQSEALSSQFPDFYHESPHNVFGDAAVSHGIPGLLSLLAIIAFAGASVWRSHRRGSREAPVLLAMLIGSLVTHQFACLIIPTAFCFFSISALCVSSSAVEPRKYEQPADGYGKGPVVIAQFAALAMIVFVVQYLAFDARLAQAQMLLGQRRVHEATEEYLDATRFYLPGASTDLWFSRALAAASQNALEPEIARLAWSEAMRIGVRSIETSETPASAAYHVAVIAALNEDATAMERHLRSSIRLAPNWFKPHWLLAKFLAARDRKEEALAEAEVAVRLNGSTHPQVTETLCQLLAEAKGQ